ncbi:hypothetical protein Tco_1080919 [Tanacetum coccineum]|uniref:Uncharacterized protein n=1 Tax=Tanacetum coccineum TaxID=301880 RepID=A0ABQ5HWZ2_9ASTR
MARANPQATIVSEEQLVPHANRLVIKKNNQRVALDSDIPDTMLIFVVEILKHHKLYKPVSLTATVPIIYIHQFWTTINHNANNHTFTFELDTHTFTLTPVLLRIVLQMSPPDPNNTYTKPLSENKILVFIKTHGYDEDPDTKMIVTQSRTQIDLLLKLDIDQNENHILGPSTVAIAKKIKAIIQKDELTIADLEAMLTEAKWNSDKDYVSKPRTFELHMSKTTKPQPSFYNNNFYFLEHEREVHNFSYQALCCKILQTRIDFFKAEMSNQTKGNIYSYLRIKSVVHIVVKKKWGYGFLTSTVVSRSYDQEYEYRYAGLPRLSLNDVEDMYWLQVQDKLHHLLFEFVKEFNNALLLCKGNKRLKGRDWTGDDVVKLNEMIDKIDKTLKCREQLRRLEEYVGGRPKTVNPCTFVRPM